MTFRHLVNPEVASFGWVGGVPSPLPPPSNNSFRKQKEKKHMITADTLERAAELLDERGWTRYQLLDERSGHCCAMGAIYLACDVDPLDLIYFGDADAEFDSWVHAAATEEWAPRGLDEPPRSWVACEILTYNDAPAMEKRKVQRLLRRLARNARQVQAEHAA